MSDCFFCAIANGDAPATVVHETEKVMVFKDINPQAPTHLLVIPKQHFDDLGALAQADPMLTGELLRELAVAADDAALDGGYRTVFNTGHDGGQTVGHVHAHLLGGRQMTWPPG